MNSSRTLLLAICATVNQLGCYRPHHETWSPVTVATTESVPDDSRDIAENVISLFPIQAQRGIGGLTGEAGWIAINVAFEGPDESAQRFAFNLRSRVYRSASEWLEVRGPNGREVEFHMPSDSSSIQWDFTPRNLVRLDSRRVRFEYAISAPLRCKPSPGAWSFRFKRRSDWQEVLPGRWSGESFTIVMDTRKFITELD